MYIEILFRLSLRDKKVSYVRIYISPQYIYIYIYYLKTCETQAIRCPNQPPANVDATVSMAKVCVYVCVWGGILLAPPVPFATG